MQSALVDPAYKIKIVHLIHTIVLLNSSTGAIGNILISNPSVALEVCRHNMHFADLPSELSRRISPEVSIVSFL